jgi:putative flippase GtrA
VNLSAPLAFVVAAAVNYWLCTWLLFQRRVKWSAPMEVALYVLLVGVLAAFDLGVTRGLLAMGFAAAGAKAIASLAGLLLNFLGRRFVVFPQLGRGNWRPGSSERRRQPR